MTPFRTGLTVATGLGVLLLLLLMFLNVVVLLTAGLMLAGDVVVDVAGAGLEKNPLIDCCPPFLLFFKLDIFSSH